MFAVILIPAPSFYDVDIDFRNDNFQTVFANLAERKFKVFVGNVVEFVVSLQTDRVDGNVVRFEVFNQFEKVVAFAFAFGAVVVVDQEAIRIEFPSGLECLSGELKSACRMPISFAPCFPSVGQ